MESENSWLTVTFRADLVTLAQTQCPSSKIVMSGYSQGGQIVHNAAGLLSTSVMNAISSVVIFGDPGMFKLLMLMQKCGVGNHHIPTFG